MKTLAGTKTEANLREAFAGESMARNKYTMYESVARQEGQGYIADVFRETAHNEKEHSEIWLKTLTAIGDTRFNLKEAAEGEFYEFRNMYPRMAKEAREEGFDDIAEAFESIAAIEEMHHKRYRELLDKLNSDQLFHGSQPTQWICMNCGHVHEGIDAPRVCPVCKHAQGYFKEQCS